MAYINITELMTGICNSIREKKGTSGPIAAQNIPDEISTIESGGSGGGGYTIEYRDGGVVGKESKLLQDIENGVWIDGYNMFYSNLNFDYTLLSEKNVKLTNCHQLFSFTTPKTSEIDFSNFDTSKVFDFYGMFSANAGVKTYTNLRGIDTRSGTDFRYMFNGCTSATAIDVSGFDTSKATTMEDMFNGCKKLTSLDLSSFDTSKVENMAGMFCDCNVLTEIKGIEDFDFSNVTNLKDTFKNCKKLNKLHLKGNVKATKLDMTFSGCGAKEFILELNLEKVGTVSYPFQSMEGCQFLDLGKVNFKILQSCNLFLNPYKGSKIILPNLPKMSSSGGTSVFTSDGTGDVEVVWGEGNSFGNESTASSITFPVVRVWKSAEYVNRFVEFANSIAENTSGLTRTIKVHTNIYNALSDEQKAILTNKGYTITYGTS